MSARPINGATDRTPRSAAIVTAATMVGGLQMVVLALMLAKGKILAILLKPEGVGVVSTLDQLVLFVAQLAAFSLITTPTRFLARASNQGPDAVRSLYGALVSMLFMSMMTGTAIVVALLVIQPRVLGATLSDYVSTGIVAVLTAPVLALSGFYANVAATVKGYSTSSVYTLLATLSLVIAAFVGIRLGGITGLYVGNLLAGIVCVGSLATYLHATASLGLRMGDLRLRATLRQHPDIVTYCGTTYVISFVQPLAFLFVRSFVVQRLGLQEAGYFQAAFMVSSVASLVFVQAMRVYLEPAVNAATSNTAKMDLADEFQRMFALLALVGIVPIVLFPTEIIALLYTRAFTPIRTLIFVFVVSDCIFLFSQVYTNVLMAVNDFRAFLQTQVLGHICLCVLALILGTRFGLAGIAWSFVLARLLVFACVHWVLARRHRLSASRGAAAIVLYALFVPFALTLLFRSDTSPTVANVAVRLLAALVVGAGLIRLLKPEERTLLRSLLSTAK